MHTVVSNFYFNWVNFHLTLRQCFVVIIFKFEKISASLTMMH